jgi:hypothetical protein
MATTAVLIVLGPQKFILMIFPSGLKNGKKIDQLLSEMGASNYLLSA